MSNGSNYQQRRLVASDKKKRAVLAIAGRCFSEHGFRDCTTEEIAQRAGVSKGLVFHFFGSKQGLFTAVIEDALLQWSELGEFRLAEAQQNTLSKLRSLFLASFDFLEQHPILALFTHREPALLADYQRQFSRRNTLWRQRLARTIKQGQSCGEIRREIDARKLSVIFHDLQKSLIKGIARQGHQSFAYDRATVDLSIDLLLRGMAT